MQNPHLALMAGGSDHSREVICIEAQKVFDFCFQEEHIERTFRDLSVEGTARTEVECKIEETDITCREVSRRREIDGKKKNRFLVCVAIEVPITLNVIDELNPNRILRTIRERVVFLKQAVLCVPEGTTVQCDVTGNCCCFFDRTSNQISCVFDFCVVLESKAKVKVLVETLGMCVPKRCQAITVGCPPKIVAKCDEDCDD